MPPHSSSRPLPHHLGSFEFLAGKQHYELWKNNGFPRPSILYDRFCIWRCVSAILNPSVRWRETWCMYRKYVNLAVRATAVHRRRYGERTTNGMLRLMTSQKSIAIFTEKQRLLSIDMKTKVVQHVPRIKLDNLTTWQLDTFEHRHENKSCSACLKDQTRQLDN